MTNSPDDITRIGPIELLPGITRTNFWTFMLAAFVCIGMLATLNIAQSYILVQHLGIPWSRQGALSGNLTLGTHWSQLTGWRTTVEPGLFDSGSFDEVTGVFTASTA